MNNSTLAAARARLQILDPFLGAASLYLNIEEKPLEWFQVHCGHTEPTAATDGNNLYYYGPFIESLSPKERAFVVAHETMHCISLDQVRRGPRHPVGWNIACVVGETLVTMADGSTKPIVRIQAGDKIASPFGPSEVLELLDQGEKDVVELDIEGSNPLICTHDHKIFTGLGFLGAETWSSDLQFGWVLSTPRSGGIRSQELSLHEYEEDVLGDGRGLRKHLGVSSRSQIKGTTRTVAHFQEHYHSCDANEFRTDSLFCGISGWRRDCYDIAAQSGIGAHLFSSTDNGVQHIVSSLQIHGGPRVSAHALRQQSGAQVLDIQNRRLQHRFTPSQDSSFFGHKTPTRHLGAGLRRHAATAGITRASNSRDVRDRAEGQGAQRAWIQVRAGSRRARVYDIVTESHCFYANGLLVHNCDYRIHSILKEAGWEILPKALYDAKYNGLSAEEIYDLLKQDAQQKQKAGGSQGGEGIEAFWPEEGFGGSVMEPTSPSGGKADPSAQEALGKQWTLRAAQAAEVAKATGNLPGVYARTVTEALELKIPWQEVLRRFIRDSRARLGDDYQWLPANRRHRWRDLILPSRERIGMGLLDIHVDLSGSIGPQELAEFVAEIQGIRADASPELTRVIYFDTEVGQVDLLGPEDRLSVEGVRGGGGTDLGAAFRWAEASGMRPVATVVLTDLYGPFESKKPSSPVVWCVSPGGSKEPVPYGETVWMAAE